MVSPESLEGIELLDVLEIHIDVVEIYQKPLVLWRIV